MAHLAARQESAAALQQALAACLEAQPRAHAYVHMGRRAASSLVAHASDRASSCMRVHMLAALHCLVPLSACIWLCAYVQGHLGMQQQAQGTVGFWWPFVPLWCPLWLEQVHLRLLAPALLYAQGPCMNVLHFAAACARAHTYARMHTRPHTNTHGHTRTHTHKQTYTHRCL